jgi:cation diffusion facilitator family transporter
MSAPDEFTTRGIRRTLMLEGLTDVALLAAKAIVGWQSGSLAVLSEAVHSAIDLLNNVAALYLHRLSVAPPDAGHPYGHRKYEQVAVFGLAVVIAMAGFEIMAGALVRAPDVGVTSSGSQLAVMLGAWCANIGIALWERRQAARFDSDLLRADAAHTLSDVLLTGAVIAGWQIAARSGYLWIDTLLTVIVACVVFYLACRLFAQAVPVLVDSAIADPAGIAQRTRWVEGVEAVPRVRSHRAGSRNVVDIVVQVNPNLTTAAAHRIADEVERILRESFGDQSLDVIVHVEPRSEETHCS